MVIRRSWLALMAAALGVAAAAGWWWWWHSRQPRPDLLEFVPDDAMAVIEIREGRNALAALRSADPAGRLTGLLDQALRDAVGPGLTSDRIAIFSRDEGMCAILPGGGYLAACRPGATERLADRFFSGTRLVRRSRVAGGMIRLARLPGGVRVAYTIVRGTILVSSDPGRLAAELARPPHPAPSTFALAKAALPAGYRFLLLWAGPAGGMGGIAAGAFEMRSMRRGALLDARVELAPGGRWAAWTERIASAGPPRALTAWRHVPAASLAAVAVARAGWLAAAPVSWPDEIRALGSRVSANIEAREASVVLLSVDHRGVVPMPQLASVVVGGAEAFGGGWIRSLDASLRAETHGDLALERTVSGGTEIWMVNFPVTRTLAPCLARSGTDALFASSVPALATMADAAAGGRPSLGSLGLPLLAAPAQAVLVADLPGLAAEAEAIVAGLREYGLMEPRAEAGYARVAEPWLKAAEATGRLVLTARLASHTLVLEGAILPP